MGKLDSHRQTNETGPLFYLTDKNEVYKWAKDLNLRPETIELLEENRKKLLDVSLGVDFLYLTTKAKAKTKTSKTPSD